MDYVFSYEETMDSMAIPKKLGVHVECICCPHKSSIPDSLPLLPLFPRLAMKEIQCIQLQWKQQIQLGLNMSLSVPIDLEVQPLIPLIPQICIMRLSKL